MVASLTPLFGSSAASAALQNELEGRCRSNFAAKMPAYALGESDLAADFENTREVLRSITESDPAFDDPTLILRGNTVDVAKEGGDGVFSEAQIIGIEGFQDHLTLVAGDHGEGGYIDQRTAETIGAGPGDQIELTVEVFNPDEEHFEDRIVPLSVTAVFDDLNDDYLDPYWCTLEDALAPNAFGDPPPAPLIVDTSVFQDDPELFFAIYGFGHEPGQWELPVRVEGLTVTGANQAVATLDSANQNLSRLLGDAFGGPFTSSLEATLESGLLQVSERVTLQSEALQTSILPLATVVLLAAVGLIGAAGSYWVERRRTELGLLSAIGVPPVAIAFKAGLELLVPVLIGALAGCALGNALIGGVGPSPDIETSARWDGLTITHGAAGIGLLTAAAVAGVRARTLLDRNSKADRQLRLRWPLIVLSVAAAVLVRLSIGDQAVRTGENVVVGSVDPMTLFFPVLILIAAVLLMSELVTLARPIISRLGGTSHSGFIASRRVLSAPAVALALLAGAAVPVAILIYSANLARSATISTEAKGKTSIGSDVSTPVYRIEDLPPAVKGNSTIVIKFERARLNREVVDVLAVDPETFAEGGFWLDTYADRSLDEVLASLTSTTADGALAAVVANAPIQSGTVDSDGGDFDVEIVGSVAAFPGSVRDRPLLVIDRDRLSDLLAPDEERIRGGRHLLWTKGLSETEIEDALKEADIGFAFTTAADTTLDQLKFAVIVWTFEFLRLYAALAGLIVISSVLIYTDTRQRARNLSYALARRMGLTRRDHMTAGFLEVGSLVLVGSLIGIAVGRWTSRDLYLALDPLPDIPPVPQWVGTTDLTVLVLVVVLVVAALSAWTAQRTADNADVSELLRHSG
jgi:putative ABC transport system permease protein